MTTRNDEENQRVPCANPPPSSTTGLQVRCHNPPQPTLPGSEHIAPGEVQVQHQVTHRYFAARVVAAFTAPSDPGSRAAEVDLRYQVVKIELALSTATNDLCVCGDAPAYRPRNSPVESRRRALRAFGGIDALRSALSATEGNDLAGIPSKHCTPGCAKRVERGGQNSTKPLFRPKR